MKALFSASIVTTHAARLTRAALFGLGVSLFACAGASDPVGGGSQPITEGESPDDGEEGGSSAACAGGVPVAQAENCQVVANGLCFATTEAACACDGCGLEECAIAESFPLQAFCQNGEPGGSEDPDEPVSDDADGDGSDGSPGSCGEPGGGSDPHPGGEACEAGSAREAPDAPCDFSVGDLCFDSGDAACACAGCAAGACLVLESYPAQIRCATNE